MHIPVAQIGQNILFDIGLIVIVAAVLAYIFRSLKQPGMVAYVITGFVLGPFGLSLITNQQEIITLSELGVAFLLFMAGVELEFSKLGEVGKVAVITGALQTGIAFLTGFTISNLLQFSGMEPYYLGLAVSFSSTMAVVKILSDKRKINALSGRISIGILLIEDIIIILALSVLSQVGVSFSSQAFIETAASGLGLVSIAIVLGRYVLPEILRHAAGNRELFFLVSVATAFFFIGLASVLGFSIAIGGFVGGLALATYPFNTEIRSEILPLRNFFTVLFFASLGMQVNIFLLGEILIPFLLLLAVLMVLKPVVITGALSYFGYGSKTPVLVGLGLAQGSEFIFVLAREGVKLGHIGQEIYTMMISLTLISIASTPYLHKLATKLGDYFSSRFPSGFISRHQVEEIEDIEEEMEGHLILLGCDRTGSEILEKVHDHDIVVIDHDPEILGKLEKEGYISVYGEADSVEVLERTGIKNAKMVISTVPDFETNKWLANKIRDMDKDIKFISRADTKRQALELYRKGADRVVLPERIAGDKMFEEVKRVKEGKVEELEEERREEVEEINEELG